MYNELDEDVLAAIKAVDKYKGKNVPVKEIAQLYGVDPEVLVNYHKFYGKGAPNKQHTNIDNLMELKKIDNQYHDLIGHNKSRRDEIVLLRHQNYRDEIKPLKERAAKERAEHQSEVDRLLAEISRKKKIKRTKTKRKVKCKCIK